MFVLFSSNAERLFQRGILEAISLPDNYPRTFRYQSKYVAPQILDAIRGNRVEKLLKTHCWHALIVYAQQPISPDIAYKYCPVRFATIVALRLLGDIVFAEIRFRSFPNLANWSSKPEGQASFDTWLVTRTGAIERSGEGEFCSITTDHKNWHLSGGLTSDDEAWQIIVDRLAKLPSMNCTLFYRIRGLFYPSDSRFRSNSFSEIPISPRSTPGALTYQIEMSKTVDLKLLFYRPRHATPKTIKATLEIDADKSGFSEVPTRTIRLESRYDELTVRLVTRRVFDNTLAPVAVRLKEADCANILTSEPLLLCVVRVPWRLLAVLLLCFFFAPILLTVSAADIASILSLYSKFSTSAGLAEAAAIAARCLPYVKVTGGLLTAIAAWLAFRRFPVK